MWSVALKSRLDDSPSNPNGFIEWTDGATLYRAKLDLPSLQWVVTSFTKIEGHDKRMSLKTVVMDNDVEDELHELGIPSDFQARAHGAMRLGMLKLKPQIAYFRAQLLGEDYEPATLGEKVEMDPVLVKALQVAEQEKREREEKLRIAQERKQQEQDEMESAELWGAF